MTAQGRLFFQMPEEQKMKIFHSPSPNPQRGWSKIGGETTSKLRKENAVSAPSGAGELLDEKVALLTLKITKVRALTLNVGTFRQRPPR